MVNNKVKKYLKNSPRLYPKLQRIFYIFVLLPKYKIKKSFLIFLTPFFIKLPIKNNKIVMTNFNGKGYGCNPKYIAEELLRQKLNYDIVWVLKKELIGKAKIPKEIRIVEYESIKHLYELATARVWIDNERKYFYSPKRKKQFYIQTYHGVVALKQVEKDVEKQLPVSYVDKAKNDSKMIDLFIANSKFNSNLYRRAFWYEGEVLEVGAPRCEILIKENKNILDQVRNYFNITEGKRILLYAPTFRANSDTKVYNVDFETLIQTLEKKYCGEWIVLVRLHPDISTKADFLEYNSKILNATDYDDMNELLSASDILITDYSSSVFEFSFTKKPIFLYAPDIKEYIEERNFYFDIRSLPYPLAENNNQLQTVIEGFDKSRYLIELDTFFKKIGIFDPKGASAKIVKIINDVANQNTEFPNNIEISV
ncbi:CDP-glycerol glycerophosphotransferase family protein [Neobacillus massiliamazoniensis]|uniref:CDP-glycerol:poly(Glycerophosphate) glycerophosphotransferase n=1 Tax=Neobacillus massiliamazoniensis TaxID=1499688 RepID=A0A0U1NVA9_9BACI|nr:CDP-glycerol glycerophosphotransferase family protein [Neobacillus massiliamazoniensis]CRK81692.1 CDP-glycerol:poly(glycerophosphate) glycerophosphotransferase [Neobacillus massiliamazoniensis]